MTNEFKHKTAGVELKQDEWEGIGYHIFNNQSTGDTLYASSGTQLSRLGIESTNNLLTISGGIPAWTATPTVTSLTTDAISMGSSSSHVTSATVDKRFADWYLTSSSTSGNAYGLRIEMKKSAISTGSPRTLTLWCVLDHPSGHTAGGGNALHSNTYLSTGNTGIAGEAHAMASHLIVASESRTVQGTWCAHKFVNEFEANNTMPANSTFFARFHDAGTVKTPLMFDFSGLTADSANCIVADTGAVPASTYYLRVKCPDDSTGYIPICGGLS